MKTVSLDTTRSSVQVLHVDDDPGQLDVVSAYFEREQPAIDVTTTTRAAEGVAILEQSEVDCVVSDYEMPEMTGLEFLEHVRAADSEVPFILYTGKGSEKIASKAINSGVTGYLQKGGPEQLQRLINRVVHAAEEYRTRIESERYATTLKALGYPIYVVDENAEFTYVNDAFVEMVGYDHDEIIGSGPSLIKTEEGVERANEALRSIVSSSGPDRETFHVDIQTKGGRTVPCRDHMAALPFEETFRGSVGILRDISQQEQRRERLAEQNRRLEEIISFVSHDLRTPLAQARAGLELAQSGGSEEFDRVELALDRMEEMIEELRTLARTGITVGNFSTIELPAMVERSWETLAGENDSLECEPFAVEGDPDRVRSLVDNLLRNAVEHGSTSPDSQARQDAVEHGSTIPDTAGSECGVTVTVGPLDDDDGFYVADDGPGIPDDERDRVFEPGYTTAVDGTGFGLSIVKRVSEGHEWELTVTESEAGGARFEFRDAAVRSLETREEPALQS